ncbi:DUF3278 domain-containing protein [Apilactobacillus apisilvae]|uniref:DUF3278 domain-containing protein n=1 Tax=Apilactobacillus apisilvae TaxID=2923364 RepID=A0ABY4PG66_9LACO|nr:DUF3278 domain-containing protein [Apilactobacillus apisilvae]UQS84668.1 DUF3278 domain-containing protein [Apilactobacillus apisilvae]
MKNKESLFTKYLKMFYGISGPLDEYKTQTMNRIGNKSFIACWLYMAFLSLFLIYYGMENPKISVTVCIASNFIFLMILSISIIVATKKAKLTTNEVFVDNYKQAKRKAAFKGIGFGIYFAIAMYLITPLMQLSSSNKSYIDLLKNPDGGFLGFIVGGFVFGLCMYLVYRMRMKKMK